MIEDEILVPRPGDVGVDVSFGVVGVGVEGSRALSGIADDFSRFPSGYSDDGGISFLTIHHDEYPGAC